MEIRVKTKIGYISVFLDKPYVEETKCKDCGMTIFWAKPLLGKMLPISIVREGHLFDYKNHLEDCPHKKEIVKRNNYEDNKNIF